MTLLPRRLNARIILIVSVILIATSVATGWVSARSQTARLLADMRLNSSIMVNNLAESCARYLLVQDYAELETFLLKSAEMADIRRLLVCEADGSLVWDVTHDNQGEPRAKAGITRVTPPTSRAVVLTTKNDLLTIWHPIEAGSLLGWLKVDYGMSHIREAQVKTWQSTIIMALVRVCLSAFLIILMLRPFVRSIGKLSAFAIQLDEHKGAQIAITGQPLEVAELGASLNEASVKLLSTEQELLNKQKLLRNSEENYRRLLDTIQEGIWVIDTDAITTFVNPRMAEILGYTTAEMVGKSLFTFMDEQGKKIAEVNVERRKQGIKEQHEFEFIKKDGERIYTKLEIGPIFDETGNYIGSIASVADITVQMKMEQQRLASEQAFRAVVENSPDVIVRYDRDGRRIYVNPEFERVNHLTAQEVLGKNPVELSTELAPVASVFTEKLMAAMASGTVTKIDLSWTRGGKPICWFVRVVPEFDADGNVVSALTIWSDITERKLAEEEISKLNEELEQRVLERTAELNEKNTELEGSQRALMNTVVDLNLKTTQLESANGKLQELDRLKSMFIASMSHELRTPLNSIIGFSSIIRDEWLGPVNPEQKENLDTIQRSGKYLLSLINDVIDVSKIEAGKIESRFEEFDLYDLLTEAVQYVEKDARDKGLELHLAIGHHPIFTDKRRLLQCVINLLSNAVKFTEHGGVNLSSSISDIEQCLIERHPSGMSFPLIDISVKDSGIGIPSEDIPRLFNAFVRLESPLKTSVPGTGLGLYLTRKLVVEVLHGGILCKSNLGTGSTFTLRIPERINEKGTGS